MKTNEIFKLTNVVESLMDDAALKIKKHLKGKSVVILEGPVGAGKTTFSKSFSKLLGNQANDGDTEILSPTYSIINENKQMVHADFFRIKTVEEIVHLEFPLYLDDKKYIFIEWGKKWLDQIIKIIEEDVVFYQLNFEITNDKRARNLTLFDFLDSTYDI